MSKDFEDWFAKEWAEKGWGGNGGPTELCARRFSEMAFEFARKDHYRIGEEVETRQINGCLWVKGRVKAGPTGWATLAEENVRRVPEWEPKEGEAVFIFTGHENCVHVGRFDGFDSDGGCNVIMQSGACSRTNMNRIKPFSADKIGKPWNEI